ncbi:MAG: hypothetical protein Kow00103_10410 [Candidatus Caldatribacteriota bacterium]
MLFLFIFINCRININIRKLEMIYYFYKLPKSRYKNPKLKLKSGINGFYEVVISGKYILEEF